MWTPAAEDERGFALIELLVVLVVMVVVMSSLMTPLITSDRTEARDVNYAEAQGEARSGLDSMVAEIRQATAIIASGPNFVEMNVTLLGSQLLVEYECDIAQTGTGYRECVRVQAPAGGSLPSLSSGKTVLANLLNGTSATPVFSWGPDPNSPDYMTATVAVPASGGNSLGLTHSIVFSDGALMRNLQMGN